MCVRQNTTPGPVRPDGPGGENTPPPGPGGPGGQNTLPTGTGDENTPPPGPGGEISPPPVPSRPPSGAVTIAPTTTVGNNGNGSGNGNGNGNALKNIFDTLQSKGYTTLGQLLTATGVDAPLKDDSAVLTIFAPSNNAFDAVPTDLANCLIENPDILSKLLLYHVVVGEIDTTSTTTSNDLADGQQQYQTVEGSTITVSKGSDGSILINGAAAITEPNVAASNGVVQGIDDILVYGGFSCPSASSASTSMHTPTPTPTSATGSTATGSPTSSLSSPKTNSQNLIEALISLGNYGTFTQLLNATGVNPELENESNTFTIFAPTDDAFRKLPSDIATCLIENPSILVQVLLYHILPGSVSSTDLSNSASLTTVQGSDLQFSGRKKRIKINGGAAKVVGSDITTSNGIIHTIDNILIYDGFECPTSSTDTGTSTGTGSSTGSTVTIVPVPAPASAPVQPSIPVPVPSPSLSPQLTVAPTSIIVVVSPQLPPTGLPSLPTGTSTGTTGSTNPPATPTTGSTGQAEKQTKSPSKQPQSQPQVQLPPSASPKKAKSTKAPSKQKQPTTSQSTETATTTTTTTLAPSTTTTNAQNNALETLRNAGFTTFADYAVSTGLDAGLQDEANILTVLAPTNEAFASIPKDIQQCLQQNPEVLTQLILYHILPGNFAKADLENGAILTSAQGNAVSASRASSSGDSSTTSTGILINGGATLTATDIRATNAVIHGINNVLVFPGFACPARQQNATLLEQLGYEGNSILVQLLATSGLDSLIQDQGSQLTIMVNSTLQCTQIPDLPFHLA
jgi:transforming growth factor-beta-induced protein